MTITERRRAKAMALGELARACNLGTAIMSRIERGRETPPDSVWSDIAKALGCAVEEAKAGVPSSEEVAAEIERFSDAIEAMGACHKDAKDKGLGKGRGGVGEIECPICKGRLRYSVAGLNGHLWGACATDGCVRWMQ